MNARIFSRASSAVIVAPTAEALFGLWWATAPRADAIGTGLRFASFAEVEAASAHGAAGLGATIEVRLPGERTRVATTVGRVLLARSLPEQVGFNLINRPVNAVAAARIIESANRFLGIDQAWAVARELWSFGERAAAESGLSISIDDLANPRAREAILADGCEAATRTEKQWDDGLITGGERERAIADGWIATEARVRDALVGELAARQPLGALEASGALSGIDELGQCVGMVGVTRNSGGEVAEIAILRSFAEGLSAHQSFRVVSEARATAVRRLDAETEARALGEQLTAALGSVVITLLDCGAPGGVRVGCLVDSHRVLVKLGTRLLGRTLADDVRSMDGLTVLATAGAIVDEAAAARIDHDLTPVALVRSPITCAAATGVCARCHGWTPGDRVLPPVGARVGLTSAGAIASLAPSLVTRRLSLSSNGFLSECDADATTASGLVRHERLDLVATRDSDVPVMLAERGRIVILDERGEEAESFRILRGDRVQVEDGSRVLVQQRVVARDGAECALQLANVPVGAEAFVSFPEGDVAANVTSSYHCRWGRKVLSPVGTTLRLDVVLEDGSREVTNVEITAGAHVLVAQGGCVRRGEILAEAAVPTIPWFRDPWGGLPRVLAILRAEEPIAAPILAEVDGILEVLEIRGKGRRIRVDPTDGGPAWHRWLPTFHATDWPHDGPVRRGAMLARFGSSASPRDLLRIFGVTWLALDLHAELRDIFAYSRQPIAEVHLELVIHEMLRYTRVESGRRVPRLLGVQDLARPRPISPDS